MTAPITPKTAPSEKSRHKIKLRKLLPYFMIGPSILIFLVCYIYPIFYMVFLSFHDWNFVSPDKAFVGLKNFTSLFANADFLKVMANTTVYTLSTVVLTITLSLLFALFLNKKGEKYNFAQAAIFSPHITSWVSISFIWLWLMEPNYGVLNWLLGLVGIDKLQWLKAPQTALPSLIVIGVWKLIGYDTLIMLSGLQSIPRSVLQAAKLDNTPKHRLLTKIILPMMSPTIFFLVVMNTLMNFQVFDTVSIMTQGGPLNATNTLVYYIYQNGFSFFKMGYASAAGVVLFIILGALTAIYFKVLNKKVHYS